MDLNTKVEKTEKLIAKKDEELKKLIEFMKNYFSKYLSKFTSIESIILFGSYATKDFTDESDIDLCILYENDVNINFEDEIFEYMLDMGKEIDKSVQCVFIPPKDIRNWDRIFIENILIEGQLIYGTSNYRKTFLNSLSLESFLIITLDLRDLDNSAKMKIKRALYGYKTDKKYLNKTYTYKKVGIVQQLSGIKLGRGSFVVPESHFSEVNEILLSDNVKFSSYRIWMQEI